MLIFFFFNSFKLRKKNIFPKPSGHLYRQIGWNVSKTPGSNVHTCGFLLTQPSRTCAVRREPFLRVSRHSLLSTSRWKKVPLKITIQICIRVQNDYMRHLIAIMNEKAACNNSVELLSSCLSILLLVIFLFLISNIFYMNQEFNAQAIFNIDNTV